MFGLSMQHMLLLGIVVLLLFGSKGKISEIMGDFAKGIKSFKKGMSDDETADAKGGAASMRSLENRPASPVEVADKQNVG